MPDGRTVKGMAYAAIRAQRGTPATGVCAALQAARTRPPDGLVPACTDMATSGVAGSGCPV